MLKQLRNIWEREVQDGSTHMFNTNTNKDDDQHVPLEFLTMRRRPARRASSARSSKSETPKIYNFDLQSDQQHQPMSSILADLKEATDQLAAGIKNVDFLNGLEQSRDSGFGSFSDSIISDTDESTISENEECPGYFPVTMSPIQVITLLY